MLGVQQILLCTKYEKYKSERSLGLTRVARLFLRSLRSTPLEWRGYCATNNITSQCHIVNRRLMLLQSILINYVKGS